MEDESKKRKREENAPVDNKKAMIVNKNHSDDVGDKISLEEKDIDVQHKDVLRITDIHFDILVNNNMFFRKKGEHNFIDGYLTRREGRNFSIISKSVYTSMLDHGCRLFDIFTTCCTDNGFDENYQEKIPKMEHIFRDKLVFSFIWGVPIEGIELFYPYMNSIYYIDIDGSWHSNNFPNQPTKISNDFLEMVQGAHQISFVYCDITGDINLLRDVHNLTICECLWANDISGLGNIKKLQVYNVSEFDGSFLILGNLAHVNTLELSDFGNDDVSSLGHIPNLLLNNLPITDVSMLGNVHRLDLKACDEITDVSMLGNVHTLNLSGCTGITDVSMLGKVHTLNLRDCTGITDVSMLGKVHTLNLTDCDRIPDNDTILQCSNCLYRTYEKRFQNNNFLCDNCWLIPEYFRLPKLECWWDNNRIIL